VSAAHRVWTLDAEAVAQARPRLCAILTDCVGNGASIGFLDPLSIADADAYWARIEGAVAARRCLLLAGALADGPITGTVQLDVDTQPNQPHRATVSKLLVDPLARRRGLGEALMLALEQSAREAGRWLLTLDTATGEAERLYERLGFSRAGAIPEYAMNPDAFARNHDLLLQAPLAQSIRRLPSRQIASRQVSSANASSTPT
jgi:ribosomal protein S18 acetylase RimI-like enzyme